MRDPTVAARWLDHEILGIDCLLFGDGRVVILSMAGLRQPSGIRTYAINPVCETRLQGVLKFLPDAWLDVDLPSRKVTCPNGGFLYGGEGHMGNEGYLVHTASNGELKWAFFSTASNPLTTYEVVGDEFIAESTSGIRFKGNLDEPEAMRIVNADEPG